MEGPLLRLLISSQLFLVGRFLKIFSSETTWQNKAKFLLLASMEGPL